MAGAKIRSERRVFGIAVPERVFWWIVMTMGVSVFFALVTRSHAVLYYLGIATYGRWFHDLFAILASNDAVRLGIDPYIPNPLDYLHRPHVYSSWWLNLRFLGLTRADTPWLGMLLVLAFMAVALGTLRPKTGKEAFFYAGALCSSPVLLAINRANNDLVVFLVLAAVPFCLTRDQRLVRILAVFLIIFAGGLKFYPVVAGLLLLSGEDREEMWVRLLVFSLLSVVLAIGIAGDLARGSFIMPDMEGIFTFGSIAIPSVLKGATIAWKWGAWLIGGLVFLVLFFRDDGYGAPRQTNELYLRFLMGAVILCACFWLNMNFSYRYVFALWMLPYLWERWMEGSMAERLWARATAVLLLLCLWMDTAVCLAVNLVINRIPDSNPAAWADRLYLVEQPVIWAFFFCLLGYLAGFAKAFLRKLRLPFRAV